MSKIRLTNEQVATLGEALDIASGVLRTLGENGRASKMEALLSEQGNVERITVRLRDRWMR
jgi:hypothetical protein